LKKPTKRRRLKPSLNIMLSPFMSLLKVVKMRTRVNFLIDQKVKVKRPRKALKRAQRKRAKMLVKLVALIFL